MLPISVVIVCGTGVCCEMLRQVESSVVKVTRRECPALGQLVAVWLSGCVVVARCGRCGNPSIDFLLRVVQKGWSAWSRMVPESVGPLAPAEAEFCRPVGGDAPSDGTARDDAACSPLMDPKGD